jgi:gas vesicle protein
MMRDNRVGDEAGGYFGWFLLGAAVGAAAALLTTTRTGSETRELLTEKGGELARRAQELADEAQGRASTWLDRGRDLFEEQTQRLMSAFEAGKEAMREEMGKGSAEPRV